MSPSTRRREQLPAINRNAARDQSELPPAIIGMRTRAGANHTAALAGISSESNFSKVGITNAQLGFPANGQRSTPPTERGHFLARYEEGLRKAGLPE